jgi:hypothetical protein
VSDEGRLIAGRYRLIERIGRGGMGTVWRAEDEVLGREIALKRLHAQQHLAEDELATVYERTRREARSAARITHPNVVVVHDVLDDEGLPCIVMEYVHGTTLGALLKGGGALPPGEAARVGLGMVAALRAAHAAGVLHRDVKPGNVLLGENGRVVLTDFGIAMATGTSTLTRTGEIIGSIDYIAPERMKGHKPGPSADLWALGATLFQSVEGRPPFRKATAMETAYAIAVDPLAPMRAAGPLELLIEMLLAKDPDERPSAEVTERALRVVASEAPGTTRGATAGDHDGTTGGTTEAAWASAVPGRTTATVAATGPTTSAGATLTDSGAVSPAPIGGGGGGGGGSRRQGNGKGDGTGRRGRRRRPLLWSAAAVTLAAAAVAGGLYVVTADNGDNGGGNGGGNGGKGSPTATSSTAPEPAPVPVGFHLVTEKAGAGFRGWSGDGVEVPAMIRAARSDRRRWRARAYERNAAKASSTDVFQRSASTPLTCSMRMRLVSAVCSWLFSTCDCSSVRCWSIAMVATSARAWASAMSSSPRRCGVLWKRLSAPTTRLRSRSGMRVRGHVPGLAGLRREARPGRGHLRPRQVDVGAGGAGAVALDARALVVLEREELQQAGVLVRGGDDLQFAVRVHEQDAGRRHVEQLDAARGQPVQQVDDVEVLDQGVRDLHEDLGQTSFAGHGDHPFPVVGRIRPAYIVVRIVPEAESAGDHVVRDLPEGALTAVGVGPQAQQGLLHGHAQLDTDHPGGLVHDRAVQPGRPVRNMSGTGPPFPFACPFPFPFPSRPPVPVPRSVQERAGQRRPARAVASRTAAR